MTCKDCVHYEVCNKHNKVFERELSVRYCAECDHFKPKSRFVELPCEVGQTVYSIVWFPVKMNFAVEEGFVNEIFVLRKSRVMVKVLDCDVERYANLNITVPVEDFGKTVFLSRDDAEKALKEREKE